jgi:Icc-related predicted phosphoesterase
MTKKITFISDTHTKHHDIPKDELPGGDIIIHCGDISSRGYRKEILQFLTWFSSLDQYTHKIFIAGNHDFFFQDNPLQSKETVAEFPNVIYLEDNFIEVEGIKIYGSPWQPEFFNWAFNLPRNGDKLKDKWKVIPSDTDILITHGPPFGCLDMTIQGQSVGCEIMTEEIKRINPIIHCFGHIHYAYGYTQRDNINFINACSLGENYIYQNKPLHIDLDVSNRMINFV